MNLLTYKADNGVSHRSTLDAPVVEEAKVKSNSCKQECKARVSGLSTIFRTSKFSNLSILIDTYRCIAAVYIVSLRAIICLMGDYWTIGLNCDKMVVS